MSPTRHAPRSRNPLPYLALLLLLGCALLAIIADGSRLSQLVIAAVEAPTVTPSVTLAPIIYLDPAATITPGQAPGASLLSGSQGVSPAARFVGTITGAIATCNRTAIQGTLHDGHHTLNGLRVRVWWQGAPPDAGYSQPSGTIPDLGPGGYEVFLGDRPVGGWWLVAVVDAEGQLVSEPVSVETMEGGCTDGTGRQVVRVDFWRREGTLGEAGPTLTPVSAITVATATPLPEAQPTEPPLIITPIPPPPTDGIERTLKIPILMYHYISAPPEGADRVRHDLSVGPDLFRSHLVTLRERGYTSITLSQLYDALTQGAPLPEKPVVLTFDDGYRDNYVNAFPIMKEEGFVGTFFIVTDLVEERNVNYMTWEQVVEMKEAGMEIGSHTRTHVSLPGEGQARVWQELSESRALMQERLGQEIYTFAYPYGDFDDGVAHLTNIAGYRIAVTTKAGVTHTTGNLMTLRRVRVHGGSFPAEVMKDINYWMFEAKEEPK